jgi:hypothetical protein
MNQVMAEKRRKLKETWDRVISMYEKDAPEQWEDLKKLWLNYQVPKANPRKGNKRDAADIGQYFDIGILYLVENRI